MTEPVLLFMLQKKLCSPCSVTKMNEDHPGSSNHSIFLNTFFKPHMRKIPLIYVETGDLHFSMTKQHIYYY